MYTIRNNWMIVLGLFLNEYKARFYLREITKLSGLSLKTTQNVLSVLEKNKILIGKTEGKNKYFSLNLENIDTKHYLLHAEIFKTEDFLRRYAPLKSFLKMLSSNIPLVVFGSFSRLSAGKDSDIDLLMIADKKDKIPEYLIPYSLHKIILSEKAFLKGLREKETLIMEIVKNHKVLNNHSFLVNALWEYYAK